VPFDQSVADLGASLDGLPESMRDLQVYLDVTTENLETISEDISTLADDIGTLNERVVELGPILDEYLVIIQQVGDDTRAVRGLINENVALIKQAITVLTIWFGLTQVAPLYLGFELLLGRREDNLSEQTEAAVAAAMAEKKDGNGEKSAAVAYILSSIAIALDI
jgi:hypothetical protein